MKSLLIRFFILILFLCMASYGMAQEGDIQLIVRGDDMGFSHAANAACIQAYQEGILTTAEVIVPGPWFLDAVEMLNENPGLDVGVHLALTSEWENYKWGPVTNSPTLVDDNGYFPTDNNGFFGLDPSPAEIEAELRKQIEMAVEHIPHVSHLSYHMGTAVANNDIIAIVYGLSVEYNLPMEPYGDIQYIDMWNQPVDHKADYFANFLENLTPGLYVFICHPALDNDETQAIIGLGQDAMVHMAEHRDTVTQIMCSENIRQIIDDHEIELISYMDTYLTSNSEAYQMGSSSLYNLQIYQMPSSDATYINYTLSDPAHVLLRIYNLAGQEIITLVHEDCDAASYQVSLSSNEIPSGMYIARLDVNSQSSFTKLVLIE